MEKKSYLSRPWVVLILATLCTFLWGSAFPAVKKGYELFHIQGRDLAGKMLFAGIRFTLAGLIVLVAASILTKKVVLPKKRDLLPVMSLGAVQTTLQYIFFYIGLSNATGTKSSVISSGSAFIVVAIAPLIYKNEKMNLKKVIGCILGLTGIIIVNYDGSGFGSVRLNGEGFIFISTVCSAAAFFLSKVYSKKRDIMLLTGYQLFFGGVVLMVIGIVFGGRLTFREPGQYLIMIYLSLLSSVAFTIWTALLSRNPVSEVSVYNLLVPIFGALLSGIILHENIFTWGNIAAICCVCIGIACINLRINKGGTGRSAGSDEEAR